MKTHKFNLVSGPECEVKELTGKHQRLLTEQKNKKIGENLSEVLEDVVVRIGSQTTFEKDFFGKKMLAADKKKILTEVRQFSNDNDPTFVFKFEYRTEDGVDAEYEHEVDLSGGFPETPYKAVGMVNVAAEGEEPNMVAGMVAWTVAEYEEVEKYRNYRTKLPRSGETVELRLLDGFGETLGAMTKKDQRSSHTPIMMRSPRIVTITDKKEELLIVCNLDRLAIKDIEHLRTVIKAHEGRVDTEIRFEHPEADNKPHNEKLIDIDLTGQLAFFFPSEAI